MRESFPEVGGDEDVYTVTEVSEAVRQCLETEFPRIAVVGEIANFKRHTSGHLYFSLRDGRNALRIVMFRRNAAALGFEPADGEEVVASGRLSHYGGSGATQLVASGMQRAGRGELELAFRRLLQQLTDEGLTDPARKRPIAKFPSLVAVVTSPTGAVIRDIIGTLKRRWPVAEILHIPADVQGDAAPGSIERAFEALNGIEEIDAVILARGGGSIEDLWTFNTERVARAVVSSVHPVITGIGHETDTTIADMVSDLRAATPTAAAELVAPVPAEDVLRIVDGMTGQIGRLASAFSGRRLRDLELLMRSSSFPALERRLDDAAQRLDRLAERLPSWWRDESGKAGRLLDEHGRVLEAGLERAGRRNGERLAEGLQRLRGRRPEIGAHGEKYRRLVEAARVMVESGIRVRGAELDGMARTLAGLGPEAVVERGYAVCTDASGKRLVTDAASLSRGDDIVAYFRDGGAVCRVGGKRKGRPWRKNSPSRNS